MPTLGDGRQSGTSANASILNATPESLVGGAMAILRTGDGVVIDLGKREVQMLISDDEISVRKKNLKLPKLHNDTPWQEIYRKYVNGLADGACLKLEQPYTKILDTKWFGRHSH